MFNRPVVKGQKAIKKTKNNKILKMKQINMINGLLNENQFNKMLLGLCTT